MSDSSGPHTTRGAGTESREDGGHHESAARGQVSRRGQQREEEESGGTGRGVAHNYSGGAGRASSTLKQVYNSRSCSSCGGTRSQQKNSIITNKDR